MMRRVVGAAAQVGLQGEPAGKSYFSQHRSKRASVRSLSECCSMSKLIKTFPAAAAWRIAARAAVRRSSERSKGIDAASSELILIEMLPRPPPEGARGGRFREADWRASRRSAPGSCFTIRSR